ncbi:hypothetical protein EQG63_03270 [Flavobacterium amnicola]|uniref:Glutamyl-tRNA synthetase n=1 Tax=Flavobacterium amnicola TaxID=2506422 RepID=A0A4Q1K5U4_9FLAO|nr:DUF4175 family protein [Flavobacterium amnicola]RXR20972.1 hypothetical protein EQG63_03270 [Flavobacterium amnicola]
MKAKEIIFNKLEDFIKKFYTNELLRGTLFFVGLGLLYFLLTSFIEYFLWLQPTGRTILFWLFVSVELFLLGRFILFPLFKLFKLQKGIDYNDASKIIGNHFSTVNDKLVNFLQLVNDKNQSELLLASIDQKANSLQPIPFANAIDFNQNKKYIPIAILPILIVLFFMLSGQEKYITESMHRVVNYKEQFLPPAPFSFILTNTLQTEQNKDFTLHVKSVGNVVPEKAMVVINDESYFMENVGSGEFKYVFEKPVRDIDFHIEANEVSSEDFILKVTTVPAIENFEMLLNFPKYLGKKSEIIKGTGNAIVPEGTQITWKINAIATNLIQWQQDKTVSSFQNLGNQFKLSKSLFQNTEYQILTSNKSVKNYEKLTYSINIVKDQEPSIKVEEAPDSLKTETPFLLGQISDDYGFSKLSIVYFPKDNPKQVKRGTIAFKQGVYDKFVFAFPSNLSITPGVAYEYYFEVFDNDALHGFKSAKSSVFSHRESTDAEKQEEFLQQQNNNINSLSKSLKAQEKQQSELEKLQNTNKEKKDLDYKEQQKMNDFIKRQKQQEELMKNFTEKIKENLDKFNPQENDSKKEELEKRLENVDKDLEKNKKLLDELKELNEKLEQEELFEKIEKFQQKSKNQTKSLEQLVELTKRYYVEKKAEQIANKLEKLAEKQEGLSDSKNNDEQKQNEINKEFDKLQKELEELQKENKELKSPLDIPNDKEKEKSIEKDLENASQELKNSNQQKAAPKQKSAAKKMQQMAQSMEMEMQGGEKEQMDEDIKMLRQIVDNLLEFSFSQEKLMGNFKAIKGVSSSFPKYIKTQQDLKYQFKHVDDSLFAMSLRNPKIGEKVTQEIGNVYYQIDKGIDYFTQNQVSRGTASQQYVFTSANNLANMLSDILNGMQMAMSGMGKGTPKPGKGQGGGMQLPDIIKKQEELGKKMGQGKSGKEGDKPQNGESGSKSGDKPGDKPGSKSGQGQGQGSNGQNGKEGIDGEGDAQNVLDILKQQQQLRDALEKELERNGLGGQGKNVLDQMKQIEKQLINKGFSQQLVQKTLNLKYELLKLEKAAQEQNQDSKRQSNTNTKEFNNTAPALPQKLQEYLNSIEILNRQTLPLRSQFNKRVQEYFKENDKL